MLKPPDQVKALCEAFLCGLETVLGEKLFGVYLHGAITFPETTVIGDVDFHVILNKPPKPFEKSGVEALFKSLAREFPPYGAELDGYFILRDDIRAGTPPKHRLYPDKFDESWALHCEHMRAGRCIVLKGPDPIEVYPQPSWREIETALHGELEYVENHLDIYPDYCILNLCRLIYSFETHDVVVSKAASAEWGIAAMPEWGNLIDMARRSYAKQVTDKDREYMSSEVTKFFLFACARIIESIGKTDN